MSGDTYRVITTRPGQRGVVVHETDDHADAFRVSTDTWEGLRGDAANRGTEVLMVRTDHWGVAHVSGRMTV